MGECLAKNTIKEASARSEFFMGGGGWRDSYGKTGNFGRVGDKSMFKTCKKAGVGRKGDI